MVKFLGDVSLTEHIDAKDGVGKRVLIAALGNPLRGDDGVGPAIIQTLKSAYLLPDNVTYYELNGSALLSVLIDSRFDKVIIVDAANIKGTPGEWIRFALNDVEFTSMDLDYCISLHQLNLPEIIAIMETLGVKIPEMIIYGIQPLDVDYSDELSEAVKDAIQPLSRTIRDEVLAFTSV